MKKKNQIQHTGSSVRRGRGTQGQRAAAQAVERDGDAAKVRAAAQPGGEHPRDGRPACRTASRLSVNDFGDEGAIVLAEGLKKNSSLLALQLGGCRISDRGAAALAEALKQNPNIGSLDLRGNNISSGLMAKISELLLTRDQRLEEQQKTAGKAELEEQRHRIRDLQQQIERIKQNERSGFLSRRELFLIVIVAVLVGFLFNPFAK